MTYRKSRKTSKRMTDRGNQVSLRVSIAKDGTRRWYALTTDNKGNDAYTWALGSRPFPARPKAA